MPYSSILDISDRREIPSRSAAFVLFPPVAASAFLIAFISAERMVKEDISLSLCSFAFVRITDEASIVSDDEKIIALSKTFSSSLMLPGK